MRRRPSPIPLKEWDEFIRVVRRLRRDCPWDRKQTHRSLRAPLLEETYEVIDALDGNDPVALRQELGDLLLHVALQATIAEQSGEFTLRGVLDGITRKLIRRHPHVFGTSRVRTAGEVKRAWERLKLAEGRRSLLEGVPAAMPSLQRALRVQERAAKVGFDWKRREEVWHKVREELEELRQTLGRGNSGRREEEFGDLLFSLVNFARFIGVNPEDALRGTVDKFIARFQYIEQEMHRHGEDIHTATLQRLDHFWDRAKRRQAAAPRRVDPPAGRRPPSRAPARRRAAPRARRSPSGTSRKRR